MFHDNEDTRPTIILLQMAVRRDPRLQTLLWWQGNYKGDCTENKTEIILKRFTIVLYTSESKILCSLIKKKY